MTPKLALPAPSAAVKHRSDHAVEVLNTTDRLLARLDETAEIEPVL